MKKAQYATQYGSCEVDAPENLEEALSVIKNSDVSTRAAAFRWLEEHATDDEKTFRAFVVHKLRNIERDIWQMKRGR